jgi:pimeloyl-[acyl-carrier protein] methyl ester esterase
VGCWAAAGGDWPFPGAHLLPASLLAAADGVVLLAGFGRFVPPDREGRRLRMALERMAAPLADHRPTIPTIDPGTGIEAQPEQREAAVAAGAQAMLQAFLAEAAAPDPVHLMPPGPADQPPGAEARRRLLRDLELLGQTTGLPAGFPEGAKLLIVEAEQDRIVPPGSRAALREALPAAEVITMAGAGHALLQAPVIPAVLEWLAGAFPVGA